MKLASCIVYGLFVLSSISWITFPFADAGRSFAVSTQGLSLPGPKARKWYPNSDAVFGWSRVAGKDEAMAGRPSVDRLFARSRLLERGEKAEQRHPADKLLRRRKADVTESYILGGY